MSVNYQVGAIHFNDTRNFGTLKFVKGVKILEKKLAALGPDMLNDPLDQAKFLMILRKRDKKTLAEVMMNQGIISGVGNYIKCESLYAACLDPSTQLKDITDADVEVLRKQIICTMKNSYKILNESSGEGPRQSSCYGQKVDPNGHPVEKIKTKDGRTTYWVPAVQRR